MNTLGLADMLKALHEAATFCCRWADMNFAARLSSRQPQPRRHNLVIIVCSAGWRWAWEGRLLFQTSSNRRLWCTFFSCLVIASVTNLYLGYLSSQQHTLGIRQYNLIKKKEISLICKRKRLCAVNWMKEIIQRFKRVKKIVHWTRSHLCPQPQTSSHLTPASTPF